ncbi:MAG: 50S ribosomal protein L4 [Acidobacteria bacterium]|nr:50S ribosomal protein L4 [Acidobacteriota bacterium]MCG2816912.1 50S ribosomal protein L4 [Candidatus Aminicenantes bacterium]MBU1474252.1 50S ribosomal protein L4 [Acidobacteriota bacterium]MBU2437606.1 50S ribosomal protein L4 [Acidobacteriota bacterium]MBU4203828.1 50S ribosomal protein L4 [Acidobacteriota bacterium]
MAKVQVLDTSGNKVKEIDAPKEVSSYEIKEHLIYEAAVNYMANQRAGTASTKTRGEVRGGGKKPWRQKGTGRARAGSTRSPLWRSGGTTHGPKMRDYSFRMPKKARRNALRSVLSSKFAEKQVLILNAFDLKEPKTKDASRVMAALNLDNALIVDSHENKNLFLSFRNIPGFKAVDAKQVNIHDVLNHKWLVFTEKAFTTFMERLK